MATSSISPAKQLDRLLAQLSSRERRSFQRIQVALGQPALGLKRYYEIGRAVLDAAGDGERFEYRSRSLSVMVEALRVAGTSCSLATLYKSTKFARRFTSEEVEALDGKLSWFHILQLCSVDDPKLRASLARQAVRNKWSSRELRRHVYQEAGYRAARGARKREVENFGPVVGLRELEHLTRSWLEHYRALWAGGDEDLAVELRDTLAAATHEGLLDVVTEVANTLAEVGRGAAQLAQTLGALEQELRTKKQPRSAKRQNK